MPRIGPCCANIARTNSAAHRKENIFNWFGVFFFFPVPFLSFVNSYKIQNDIGQIFRFNYIKDQCYFFCISISYQI